MWKDHVAMCQAIEVFCFLQCAQHSLLRHALMETVGDGQCLVCFALHAGYLLTLQRAMEH